MQLLNNEAPLAGQTLFYRRRLREAELPVAQSRGTSAQRGAAAGGGGRGSCEQPGKHA